MSYLLLTRFKVFRDFWNTGGQLERNINNSIGVAMNQVPRMSLEISGGMRNQFS